ncbi:MAG: hypothetical protein ACE141_15155 [Bryobacteraceae bacterium]
MSTAFWLGACLWLAAGPQGTKDGVIEGGAAPALHEVTITRLLEIRRVYVDRLGGGEAAAHMRDMIISSLQSTKLFVITENEARADAFLRGSAEDLIFTDTFASSDSLNARVSAGTGSNPDRTVADRRSRSASVTVGEQESTRIAERKHEATASVRLVGKDGDVLWSTTQESLGAKFRGASADVADKITKQLVKDYEAAKRLHSRGTLPED